VARKAFGTEPRRYGEVERKNLPLAPHELTAIATVLEVDPRELTLSLPDYVQGYRVKLKAARSATELSWQAQGAKFLTWEVMVDPPSTATADDMQALLAIIQRLTEGNFHNQWHEVKPDEFDRLPFGEVSRLARLQELLEKLRTAGVGVLMGTWFMRDHKADLVMQLEVHLVHAEKTEELIVVLGDAWGDYDESWPASYFSRNNDLN
jgi:hypothetical protein